MIDTPTFTPQEEFLRTASSRKMVTRLIVFAIVMFFAGLTSAYVVSMSGGYWVDFPMPRSFHYSTAFILASSIFAQLSLYFLAKGSRSLVSVMLGVTLALGLAFTFFQFQGWKTLVELGNYTSGRVIDSTGEYGVDWTVSRNGSTLVLENGNFYDPADGPSARPRNAELTEQQNTASSYFYVLTAAHLAHLLFGLLSLAVMVVMALKGRYTQEDHSGLWAGVVYWHFLGALWVYLVLFLTFVH